MKEAQIQASQAELEAEVERRTAELRERKSFGILSRDCMFIKDE
jgi:hypothetical protein